MVHISNPREENAIKSSYFNNLVGLQLSVSTLKCHFLSAQIHLCSAYLFFHRFSLVLSFF